MEGTFTVKNFLIFPLIFVFISCDNDQVLVEDKFETAVTWSEVQQKVFSQSCTFSSCHSKPGRRGRLVLEAGESYSNLVNVPAENGVAKAAKKVRVIPGNPEGSFLLQKLTSPGPGEGELMPYATEGLAADKIQLIRRWIEDGAKPN